MPQIELSPRELSIVLAALEYWTESHDTDDLYDRMDEELERETFGDAGQPQTSEVEQLCQKLYPLDSGVQAGWRSLN